MKALYYRFVCWLLNRDRTNRDITVMWADLLEKRSSWDTANETCFFTVYDLLLAADHCIDPYIGDEYASELKLIISQQTCAGKFGLRAVSSKARGVWDDWRRYAGNMHQIPSVSLLREMIDENEDCGYYERVR